MNGPTNDPNDRSDAFDLEMIDRLMTTTKQVRRRLDLDRPVPLELVAECIRIAEHAPMGGNLERNRWLVIDDPDTKAAIARRYAQVGTPYLDQNAALRSDERSTRVIESARFLIDHLAEVPVLVLAMRLDRLGPEATVADQAGYWGSVVPGVWSFQLAAHARGLGSAWTTFHLVHEAEIADLLGIPVTVTQVALLPVAFHDGGSFTPAPRRPVHEIAYHNRWKQPFDPR